MKRRGIGPDLVATILALAILLSILFIGIAIIVSINATHNPVSTLGENTTQVLTGLYGGIIGVLGSYLGHRRKQKEGDEDE